MTKKIEPRTIKVTAINGVADLPEQVCEILSIQALKSQLYISKSGRNGLPEYDSVFRSFYYRVDKDKIYFTRYYSRYKIIEAFQRWKEKTFTKKVDYVIEYWDRVQYLKLRS